MGDIVTLQGFGACTYNVIQSSNIAQTAVLNSTVAECSCDEYSIENIGAEPSGTFTYTDCNDAVQTVEITFTGLAIRCIKSYPLQPNFSVSFYGCGCSS